MKLLLVWPSAEFSTYDVAAGIRSGLIAAGHQVEDYRLYQRIKLMAAALESIAPKGEEPSVELTCLHASEALPYRAITAGTKWALIISGTWLHPNALVALRRIGVKLAIWFTEAPYNTNDEEELYLAQFADIAFVNERTCLADFQATLDKAGNGGKAVYLQHAYNPAVHFPQRPDPDDACDVLLVGSGFAERQALLEAVDWTGINLKLGGLWVGVQKPNMLHEHLAYPCLSNEDTIRLYHGAKIIINPHRWADGAESANPRTYEVAACGAFQISDYRQEIDDIFGDAIPMYQPGVPWQLSAMIRRYLADDKLRRAKAEAARSLVDGHTFQRRANLIVDSIKWFEAEANRPKLVSV